LRDPDETLPRQGLPERFLQKTLKPLVGAGVLRSARGARGGYALARDPKDVTLLEVIEAVDGPLRALAEPMTKDGGAIGRRLRVVCHDALVLVRERLAEVTLAELTQGE
jgi:Rrf2 family protein